MHYSRHQKISMNSLLNRVKIKEGAKKKIIQGDDEEETCRKRMRE